MAVAMCSNQDSQRAVIYTEPALVDMQELRDSAAKCGEAITRMGCGTSQVAAGIALTAVGQPTIGTYVSMGLHGAEEVTVVGSKAITESGFVDGAIEGTHAMTNSCAIL